ncbi:transposase [Fragilaria crotonensis]|nr:transposase [Fragilaria crotonensis]
MNLKRPSRGGRAAVMSFWQYFTDETEPHKLKSAVCKHCRTKFNHHKKSEQAMQHLNACHAFRKEMNGIEMDDRPEWYITSKMKNKRAKLSRTLDNYETTSPTVASTSSKAVSSMTQTSSIKDHLLPKINALTKERFEQAISMHYYVTGASFKRIEEPNLAAAMKMLRPDAVLPNRKKLAGPLLDKAFAVLKTKVNKHLEHAGTVVCLTTDGWSNVKNEPIVNYMATSPSSTLFLESVSTGEQSHNAEWIASDIQRVMASYPTTTFAGAVTDNTSTNKNAWELLLIKHPSAYFQGCASHGLNLFVKDIFGATKTKKMRDAEPSYPVGYPFEDLLEFFSVCKDIVKLFHNSHALKAQLYIEQKKAGVRGLVRPAPTRWGTIKGCCETLLMSERVLHAIVTARDFIKGTAAQKVERIRIKGIITSDNFVAQLEKSLAILTPIDALIVKYQSDSVPVSEVWPDFNALPDQFSKLHFDGHASINEVDYLIKLSKSRYHFMYGKAHGLAFLLDPRFIGEGLNTTRRGELENILIDTPVDDKTPVDDERREVLYLQYTEYTISAMKEKVGNSFRFKMLVKGRKTPLQYWQSDGAAWPDLQRICIKLFTLATSSAASERNFSTMGFVHTKLRNSLAPKTVEKLVYIKSNHAAFSDCIYEESEADSSVYYSSAEEEDEANEVVVLGQV